MGLGAPSPQSNPEEEYTEAKMFERLHLASIQLGKNMSLGEARTKAEDLVQQGLLVKHTFQDGPHKQDFYYVLPIQWGENIPSARDRNTVFSVEQSPDFHRHNRHRGLIDLAYTIRQFDSKGRMTNWIRRDAEEMHVSEQGSATFFPNGNPQRLEIYDNGEAKTSIREYAENDPKTPIFNKVIDHKTGREEISIDNR